MISSKSNSTHRASRAASFGCCAALLLCACADQQSLPEPQSTATAAQGGIEEQKEQLSMQRVIVNLAPSEMPVPDQVVELTRKYPQSKTLRVFASFRQVVLELPAEDMKALAADPEVQQVAVDQRNSPSN